ncbi:acyl-CoA dehydrogenase family protein [Sedimentibacter sp. zth1]|uniref:acyl-CoA dehydrogenase family protein n=1 Tax=Sedimentibacter sp. zth1 TaxID=2816908 RepID=UPI001A92FC09|nr:acyl-CoA dehydrogenase family protein [Sedimentibacter sp. zth1]QSX05649.1 acyl-CoA dehydrogenase family protein [Sedimentibacter sp. zth1]
MNLEITKEQKDLRKEVINMARHNLNNDEYLEKYSSEMFDKIAEFGLLGITIGEEYGGLNESYLTAAIVFEALGYACKNNGLIFVVNNHIWVSQNLIYLYGSKELKDKYLLEMVEGKKIGAIAITEAESGTDALSMRTVAKYEGDYYVLNGSKMFISNGPIADVFVVYAVTEDGPKKKYTAFIVEKSFEGFKAGPDIEKMGLGACPTCEIIFNNCKVPKENVLGSYNKAGLIMTQALEWERCYEFVPHIGVMQRIMEQCIEHANTRKQFGKNIGEYQSISHRIAEMKTAIEMSRLMMYKIACIKDAKKSAYLETSIFKLFVSENYIKTCRDAMQIFGGYGYSKEYDFERELRDALACSIYSGTNEMQKNTIYSIASMSVF